MSDDKPLDDDLYDGVLEDSFEDDFEDESFDDLDLDADDDFSDLDLDDYDEEESVTADDLGDIDDFDGFDDDWGDEDTEDSEYAAAGVQKEKRSFNMSFNAMAISGALILGIAVLGFQVVTKKPQGLIDRFTSALNMDGASDGPIFGDEVIATTQLDTIRIDDNKDDGFLYDPESLETKTNELNNVPPMPTPMTSDQPETQTNVKVVSPVVPDEQPDEFAATVITPLPEEAPEIPATNNVPRAPDDVPVVEIPDNKLTQKVDNALDDLLEEDENKIAAVTENDNSQKAESFLKSIMADRKKEQEDVAVVETVDVKKEQPKTEMANEASLEAAKEATTQVIAMTGAIEQKLDLIVSRLDKMESQITQVREANNVQIENISGNVQTLKGEIEKLSQAPVVIKEVPKKVTAPKAVEKAVKKTEKKPVVKKAPVKKVVKKRASKKVSWELRAAQPGKAWVSQRGQKSMKPVMVGDTLPSIGRITAISFNNNRWTVQGTTGRILQ